MGKRAPTVVSGDNHAPDDAALREKYLADIRFALQDLLQIEDRDVVGRVGPFRLNWAQSQLHEVWEDYRAFNCIRNAIRNPELQKAVELALGVPLDIRTGSVRPLIAKIRRVTVHRLIKRVAEAHKLDLSDGPIKIIIVKPRQIGASTYIQGRAFICASLIDAFSVDVMAHQGLAAQNVFRKSRVFYDRWNPDRFNLRPKADSTSLRGFEWRHGSRFVVESADGKEQARSFTFSFVHASEYAQYTDYSALAAALDTMPTWATYVEESTARGRSGPFYDDWQRALSLDEAIDAYERADRDKVDAWNGMVKVFFAWFEDPGHAIGLDPGEGQHIERTLDEEERALLRRFPGRIKLEQLKWRRDKLKNASAPAGMGVLAYFRQEYPADEHEAFQGSSHLVFDQPALAEIAADAERQNRVTPPVPAIVLTQDWTPLRADDGSANFWGFSGPRAGGMYAIGADVAEGLVIGDFSVAVIFDRCDGTVCRQVALWRGKVEPKDFGDILCLLGELYGTRSGCGADAFITPEINNQGRSTCDRIVENRYSQIYHRKAMDIVDNRPKSDDSFRFGYFTTKSTKQDLIGHLQLGISRKTCLIRDPVTLQELKIYEIEDGKFGAPRGKHDDCVMAAGLGFWGAMRAAPPIVRSYESVLEERGLSSHEKSIILAVRRKIAKSEQQNRRLLGQDWQPRDPPKGTTSRHM
ncbi:MAG TPA: hypothetical protein VD948_02855 [Rhodothermales bacterium]|nr:hypothetical protein [Rhodothermales bacterium]